MSPSQYHSVLQKLDAVLGALAEAESEWSAQDHLLQHQLKVLRSEVLKAESGHPFIAFSPLHAPRSAPAGISSSPDKFRIMLVDDDEELRRVVNLLLGAEPGVEVVAEAANGLCAIELAMSLRPDLVLMDVNMPVLDGLLATRILRSALPDTQVVIVSGNREADVERRSLSAGAIAFVAKPVSRSVLLEMVRALRRRTLHLESAPVAP